MAGFLTALRFGVRDDSFGPLFPLGGTALHKKVKRLIVHKPAQNCLAVISVRDHFYNPFSQRFKLGKKPSMLLGKNFFELISYVPRVCGTIALGADRNL